MAPRAGVVGGLDHVAVGVGGRSVQVDRGGAVGGAVLERDPQRAGVGVPGGGLGATGDGPGVGLEDAADGGPRVPLRVEGAVAAAPAHLEHRPARGHLVHGLEAQVHELVHARQVGVGQAPLAHQHRHGVALGVRGDGVAPAGEELPVDHDGAVGRVGGDLDVGVVHVRVEGDLGSAHLTQAGGDAERRQVRGFEEHPVVGVHRGDGVGEALVHGRELLALHAGGGADEVLALALLAERLVQQVVAEQGGVVLHPVHHVEPGVDLLLAEVGVLVEVFEGGLHRGLEVRQQPVVVGLEGVAVGAGGPGRDAAGVEGLAVHVLVHVEDHHDPVGLGAVQHGLDLVQERLVEAVLLGLEVLPEEAQPQVVEAPGGGVGQELVGDVGGRRAGLHVEAVEEHRPPGAVGDVHPPVGAGGRAPARHRTGAGITSGAARRRFQRQQQRADRGQHRQRGGAAPAGGSSGGSTGSGRARRGGDPHGGAA